MNLLQNAQWTTQMFDNLKEEHGHIWARQSAAIKVKIGALYFDLQFLTDSIQ